MTTRFGSARATIGRYTGAVFLSPPHWPEHVWGLVVTASSTESGRWDRTPSFPCASRKRHASSIRRGTGIAYASATPEKAPWDAYRAVGSRPPLQGGRGFRAGSCSASKSAVRVRSQCCGRSGALRQAADHTPARRALNEGETAPLEPFRDVGRANRSGRGKTPRGACS